MARIKFTIGESDVWHEIQIDYELSRQQFRDEHDLSYIIKNEQERCQSGKAKKVEIYDESGNLIAKSPDILDWNKLEYIKNKDDNEKL